MLAQIVMFDGFDPLDVIAPYEVLSAGGALTSGAMEVELTSAEGPREVPSGSGQVSLRATVSCDPQRADLVVVPGAAGGFEPGDLSEGSIPAILGRTLKTSLPLLLKECLDRPGLTVATVCGGSLILAMAGLIANRRATTHHLGMELLAATGVIAVDARVVDDGDLITGASVTSGLDVGLYLVERELGGQVANEVERLFAYERRGTVVRTESLTRS